MATCTSPPAEAPSPDSNPDDPDDDPEEKSKSEEEERFLEAYEESPDPYLHRQTDKRLNGLNLKLIDYCTTVIQ